MENKIQELTEKIYAEGVEKGQAEADCIVEEAKAKAADVIKNAQAEAEAIVAAAKKAADEAAKKAQEEEIAKAIVNI